MNGQDSGRRAILSTIIAYSVTSLAGCLNIRNTDRNDIGTEQTSPQVEKSQPSSKDFGAAAPSSTIQTSTVSGDRLHVVTWVTDPVYVATISLSDMELVRYRELPTGDGSWTTSIVGETLYVGLFRPAHLYAYELNTGEIERVAEFPEEVFIWSSDADGKSIFFGTSPTGRLYEYDVESGTIRDSWTPEPTEEYVRSVAVTQNTIYAGVGSRAGLVSIDRESGRKRDILPSEFEEESFVYDLELTEEYLVARSDPSGKIAVINLSDTEEYHIIGEDSERWFGWPSLISDEVFFIGDSTPEADLSHTLYKYNLSERDLVEISSLKYRLRKVYAVGNQLYGLDSIPVLWQYNPETGRSLTRNLVDMGMPATKTNVNSLAVHHGNPFVAGHRELFVHTSPNASPQRYIVPGEAKAMVSVTNMLYQAIYPGAYIAGYDRTTDTVDLYGQIEHEQNRPRSMIYHEDRDSLFVGTEPEYGVLGGAISEYDISSGELYVERDIIPKQTIYSITHRDNTIYVGSDIRGGRGSEPSANEAVIAAWDPTNREKRWEIRPGQNSTRIIDLTEVGGTLFGIAETGNICKIDLDSLSTQWTEGEFSHFLTEYNGTLYTATSSGIVQLSLEGLEPKVAISEKENISAISFTESSGVYFTAGGELKHRTLDG